MLWYLFEFILHPWAGLSLHWMVNYNFIAMRWLTGWWTMMVGECVFIPSRWPRIYQASNDSIHVCVCWFGEPDAGHIEFAHILYIRRYIIISYEMICGSSGVEQFPTVAILSIQHPFSEMIIYCEFVRFDWSFTNFASKAGSTKRSVWLMNFAHAAIIQDLNNSKKVPVHYIVIYKQLCTS